MLKQLTCQTLVTGLRPHQHAMQSTHAAQIQDTGVIHLGDKAPPAVGATEIISSRNLSVGKKRDALEGEKREKRVRTLAHGGQVFLVCDQVS